MQQMAHWNSCGSQTETTTAGAALESDSSWWRPHDVGRLVERLIVRLTVHDSLFTSIDSIKASNDHCSRRKVVRELRWWWRHMEQAEARWLCTQYSDFFINKLRRIAGEIKNRLSAAVRPVRAVQYVLLLHAPSSVILNEFGAVTEDEVTRL